MTENERIKVIRDTLNLTLEKFGEKIGVTRAAISNIEKGKRNVTGQMRNAICREFSVNPAYLISGTGQMFVETDNSMYNKIDKIMAGENETHRSLLKWVATLDDRDIDDISRLLTKIKSTITSEV